MDIVARIRPRYHRHPMATTTAEKRDLAVFRTMLGLGLRVGSIVARDGEDFDLDLDQTMFHVRVPKNTDTDTVVLPSDLVTLLRAFVRDHKSGPLSLRRTAADLACGKSGGGWRSGPSVPGSADLSIRTRSGIRSRSRPTRRRATCWSLRGFSVTDRSRRP
jgi:integrase